MVEVLVVAALGAALAWLRAHSAEPDDVTVPIEDEWSRWESEIHNWKDS